MIKLIVITAIFLLAVGKIYQSHILNPHFVDEEDNFVLGKYLLKGDKLYSDLFSHHQPLAYIFSAGIQEAVSPNSLFLLVKRHREAVFIWSFLWTCFLVARFGLPLLLTSVVYELSKIYLFGYLFLSESLVVYPLIYLISHMLRGKKASRLELVFLGIGFSLVLFLLLPLWPLLGFFIFWLLLKEGVREKLSRLGYFVLGLIPVTLIVLKYTSLSEYFHNVFFINFKFYVPVTSGDSFILTLIKAFLSPFISLTVWPGRTDTLVITQLLSLLALVSWIVLIKMRKWVLVLMGFVVLGLANLRFVQPGTQEYSGFHISPWYGLLALVSFYSAWQVLLGKVVSPKKVVKVLVVFLILIILAVTWQRSSRTLFGRDNIPLDWYVNYSRQVDYGNAVSILKAPGDKLFVVPDEWLIYWQADIPHAHRMVNFYAWMTKVPEINGSIFAMFKENPPAFFYCDCKWGYFGLEDYFPLYTALRKDGESSKMLILKEKAWTITPEQKEKLRFYRFEID